MLMVKNKLTIFILALSINIANAMSCSLKRVNNFGSKLKLYNPKKLGLATVTIASMGGLYYGLEDKKDLYFNNAIKSNNFAAHFLFSIYNIDANYKDKNGVTPLMLAVRFGDVRLVMKLLKSGADPNAQDVCGWSALHYYAYFANKYKKKRKREKRQSYNKIVKYLVNAGANVNIQDMYKKTPLHFTQIYKHNNIETNLKKFGAC